MPRITIARSRHGQRVLRCEISIRPMVACRRAVNGASSGTMVATATPVYHYKRQTAFTARLLEANTGRNLWVGNGQVNAGGLLFVGDGANASSSVAAIFDDLQRKGIIGRTS